MIKYCNISEVCKIFSGNSINEKIKKEKYCKDKDGIEYISTKDIGYNLKINYKNGVKIPHNDLDKFRIAPSNTVFICAEGGSAGRKLAISDRQLCFVNKLFAIVSSEKVLPKFIFYFIQSENFNKQFKLAITGLIGGVSLNKFKEFEIPILPILVQQRIVAKLDKIFAEIDKAAAAAETNAMNAKLLFDSYLREVFNKYGNSLGVKYLSEICNIKRGTTITEKQSIKGNIPVVAGGLKPTYYHNQSNRFNITITVSGSGANAGFVNLWKCPIFASDCSTVEVKDTSYDIFFIYYFLLSKQEYIYKYLRCGAAQPHVYAKDIANILIDVPSLKQQTKIVINFNSIRELTNNLIEFYLNKKNNLSTLKQSILQQAFNGELVKVA